MRLRAIGEIAKGRDREHDHPEHYEPVHRVTVRRMS